LFGDLPDRENRPCKADPGVRNVSLPRIDSAALVIFKALIGHHNSGSSLKGTEQPLSAL
jgi:hypothetical protein